MSPVREPALETAGAGGRLSGVADAVRRNGTVAGALRAAPVLLLLAALWIWIAVRNPLFAHWPGFLASMKFATPLAILAAGQLFVIVSGEFDLSVGSIVTATVAIASGVGDADGGRTWWLIALLLAGGAFVGLVNGVVTTRLGVPSFITTLGTMLIISGAIATWTGGAVKGYMPDNMREIGRGTIDDFPWLEKLPYAVIALVVVAIIAIWLRHGTDFGRKLVAAGGNPRAAALSGVNVAQTRTLAFVISGVSAVVAGIVLGGIVGVSPNAGLGLEFQAISAVVLGGAVLGGGRGAVVPAIAGALALSAMFTLLNLLGVAQPLRQTFQGVVIIGAIALSAYNVQRRGR